MVEGVYCAGGAVVGEVSCMRDDKRVLVFR